MNTATLTPKDLHESRLPDTQTSAVSWGAILAGAAAAAALSLILLVLGTGLGLSAVSPWSDRGVNAESLGVSSILWLTLTQVFASGLGGYLAGRLRTRWLATDPDEVYFRDTAHGFLAWVVASLATAALLTSVIGSIVATGVQAGGPVAGGVASAATAAANSGLAKPDTDSTRTDYFMDSLFRGSQVSAAPAVPGGSASFQPSGNTQQMTEVTRIFMNTLRTGPLPPSDASYTAQLVAQRTGLTQQEAEKRVADVYSRMQTRFTAAQAAAREAADKARKASAYAALWIFISLLGGAFVASWTAIYGGRQRDL
ncbi:MAG: hypothetical protein V4627_19075 [Pseudomonadota bacterium]